MKTIYKYKLDFVTNEIEMPKGAEVLHAEVMSNALFIWARVNTKHKLKKRTFQVFATGQELVDYDNKHYHYIRTIIDGVLVWHLYEVLE